VVISLLLALSALIASDALARRVRRYIGRE
jgi:hypothetical protein